MAENADVLGRIGAITDPVEQLRAATRQMALSQREVTELSRLRKRLINQLRREGLSFTQIGEAAGLSRGRIHQIQHGGPPVEGAFFGTGPVSVAVPLRQIAGRRLPVISSEDARAYETLARLLADLALPAQRVSIPASGAWRPPSGDVVAICGPKSSPLIAKVIAADPHLTFTPDEHGRWVIRDRHTGQAHTSPLDDADPESLADVAYLGRLSHAGRPLLVIAGVHALGSLGAVDFLTHHLPELYQSVDERNFSMVIASEHDGDTVTESRAACPPRTHP